MADFTEAKKGPGAVFPDGAKDSEFTRTEPLITHRELKSRHLFGIPLVSGLVDPVTRKADVMTPEILTDFIDQAVGLVEIETGLVLFPTEIEERAAFDLNEYRAYGYLKTLKRPVSDLLELSVQSSDGTAIFAFPKNWIETGYLNRGQIGIIPLTHALLSSGISNGMPGSGISPALFMHVFQQQWIPALWTMKYVAGFTNGEVPKVVNSLVGVVAAMEVLSALASTYGRATSTSLSIDAMSQSVSGPGNQLFQPRLEQLAEKRAMLVKKLKSYYGLNYIASSF